MRDAQRVVTIVGLVLAVVFASSTVSLGQGGRTVQLVSPSEGEVVEGPNVTFRVESSGVRLPDEHFHLLIDAAALDYVLGNPVPVGRVDMVHFRAATTTVRMTPGPHFIVVVAGDNNHMPLRPWTADSRYFFVK